MASMEVDEHIVRQDEELFKKGRKYVQGTRKAFKDLTNGMHVPKLGKTNALKKNIKGNPPAISKVAPKKQLASSKLPVALKNPTKNEDAKKIICKISSRLHVSFDVTDYDSDIWRYLNQMENKAQLPKANYMEKQNFINDEMRSILVDWLVSIAEEYKMNEQTIHLAVNYIDRFLSQMSVVVDKFQLLGAAAMMVAVKVEEVNLVALEEWVYLGGQAFTTNHIKRMEQLLLKVLNFEMNQPTIFNYIQHLCEVHGFDKKTRYTAMYISELVLVEGGSFFQYMPSRQAVAAIALARYLLNKKKPWLEYLATFSGYQFEQITPVVSEQYVTFRDSPTKAQQAVQNKYKTEKYCNAALVTPKPLVLQKFV